jgi:hypothetical protein
MIKARLISHLSELESIRNDQYMTDDIKEKVIELERIITVHLLEELEKAPDTK